MNKEQVKESSLIPDSGAAAQTNLMGELGVSNAFLTGHGVRANENIAEGLTIRMANEGDVRGYKAAGSTLLTRGMRLSE